MSTQAVTAFLLLCALAACTAGAAPRERPHAAPSTPRVIVGGYEATPKPTAPIAVSYELDGTPSLGSPLSVRIIARPADGVAELTLELTADEALYVGPITGGVGAGEHVWTVDVTPVREGLGHLNVSVTGQLDGTDQTRSLLIPIRTPGAGSVPPGASDRGDGQERVISLPAEETQTR
jgi:hypothetical protein